MDELEPSDFSRLMLTLLAKHGFPLERFVAIIDSNPLQHGKTIKGLKVVGAEAFARDHASSCSDILISSRVFEQEIKDQIEVPLSTAANVICLYDGSMEHMLDTV